MVYRRRAVAAVMVLAVAGSAVAGCSAAAGRKPGPAAASSAATTDLSVSCQVRYPFSYIHFTMSQSVRVSAPARVATGGRYRVTGRELPWVVPKSEAGAVISQLSDMTITFEVTGPVVVTAAAASGGSNLGGHPGAVSVRGNRVSLTVPGPLAAGSTATLPAVTTDITAHGRGTSGIYLAGTSYRDPGVTVTAAIPNPTQHKPPTSIGSTCYPVPAPELASTRIS